TTVFIAGSISISRLHEKVQGRILKIVSSDLNVVVGDADGADTSIQECLRACHASKVTVYCTGEAPRNNIADWPVHRVQSKARAGTRAF
ncbi:XRE family transcriptional regulator, partial [Klebsiella pneumoniae]